MDEWGTWILGRRGEERRDLDLIFFLRSVSPVIPSEYSKIEIIFNLSFLVSLIIFFLFFEKGFSRWGVG